MDRDADQAQTRRPSAQLQVDKDGRRPLFKSAGSRDGSSSFAEGDSAIRQNGSGRWKPPIDGLMARAASDSRPSPLDRNGRKASSHTPRESRLPAASGSLFSQTNGRLTLAESLRRAEQEEEAASVSEDGGQHLVDASPSPAPRPWRSKLDARPAVTQAGKELAKVTQSGHAPNLRRAKSDTVGQAVTDADAPYDEHGNGLRLPPLVPGIDDLPIPSPEEKLESPMARSRHALSPEKSYAWDVDDFTAGDLQISDSPRLKTDNRPFANRRAFDDNSVIDINSRTRINPPGSRNTKLDEIWSRELRAGEEAPDLPSHRTNTKLDEIKAREDAAVREIPIPSRRLSSPTNTKIEDIRQRELDGISKRTVATMRLEEIREKNAMSRSLSPEDTRRPSENTHPSLTDRNDAKQQESPYGNDGEEIANTPVTIYKNRAQGAHGVSRSLEDKNWRSNSEPLRPGLFHGRKDSKGVLQQLARAASTSPAPGATPQRRATATSNDRNNNDGPLSEQRSRAAARRAARLGKKMNDGRDKPADNKRLTVGFAGLKRVQSTESTNSKRSSMHSEPDPTERLEAELKLFAPTDNQSEPGSVRAQSPNSEPEGGEGIAEATPKPKRQDPLSMPTPKVTGAYVETPATIRIEKVKQEDPTAAEDAATMSASPSVRKRSTSWDPSSRNPSSDHNSSRRSSDSAGKPIPILQPNRQMAPKPRSRSLPRRKSPLRNSEIVPSVKDDLLALHQAREVEDSTLDDFEEMLRAREESGSFDTLSFTESAPPSSKSGDEQGLPEDDTLLLKVADNTGKMRKSSASPVKTEPREEKDGAVLDRIAKHIGTIKHGIKSNYDGFDRLEDRLASDRQRQDGKAAVNEELVHKQPLKTEKAEGMMTSDVPALTSTHTLDHHNCPACAIQPAPSSVAYIHIPIPRLYHHRPNFRFTRLGFLLFVLSLWYAVETIMFANFGRPTSCNPSTGPCIWSFDDPTTFGTALPIKLDQWTTGGYGRVQFNELYDEIDDWVADVVDAAQGRSITDLNVDSLLTPEKKRQHRRRLRKKGLYRKIGTGTAEDEMRWDAWHLQRIAEERADAAREMGYGWEEDDVGSIGGDARMY